VALEDSLVATAVACEAMLRWSEDPGNPLVQRAPRDARMQRHRPADQLDPLEARGSITQLMPRAVDARLRAGFPRADPGGSPRQINQVMDPLETFFVAMFAAELLINIYAHWFLDFFTNAWVGRRPHLPPPPPPPPPPFSPVSLGRTSSVCPGWVDVRVPGGSLAPSPSPPALIPHPPGGGGSRNLRRGIPPTPRRHALHRGARLTGEMHARTHARTHVQTHTKMNLT
jgi:hypothetical protein